jgi:uncharacterized protein YtpQ (UPF0354 family)
MVKNIFGQSSCQQHDPDSLFASHRLKIYPWVKVALSDDDLRPGEMVMELDEEESPIMRAWLGDLIITYVFDLGDSFQLLQARDLPVDVSMDELHEIAVSNLDRDIGYVLRETNFGGYILTAGGDHEAGAICLQGKWQWLAEHLGDDLIVSIPAKDLVLILPQKDTGRLEAFKAFIVNAFQDGERLLSHGVFKYNRASGQWSLIDLVK